MNIENIRGMQEIIAGNPNMLNMKVSVPDSPVTIIEGTLCGSPCCLSGLITELHLTHDEDDRHLRYNALAIAHHFDISVADAQKLFYGSFTFKRGRYISLITSSELITALDYLIEHGRVPSPLERIQYMASRTGRYFSGNGEDL